ncbi:MAG: LacI family DNA-binding transcriptional regulator [Candidatus Limivivens sp.]|nr:LacI family DNA-binding transcriptional regulator [Candidatus Limivivens sp.]
MRATIKDIAEHCNVSVGTVDRALNDRPGISQKTKEKILQAVEELDYHPNYMGRSLARGKTMTIGVVCFDLYNNFFPELIDTIEARAKEKGYFIHLILTHRDFSLEKGGLNYLYERQVDGIILFPIGLSKRYIDELKKMKIPIVTIYNKLDSSFPFVGVDDRSAMEDAVKFLYEKGYRTILYLTPDMELQEEAGLNTYTLRQRADGYLNGMSQCGLANAKILAKGSLEEKLDHFLASNRFLEKTAVLCLCDSYAIKALTYLQGKGIQVPGQVGLMGYDDIEPLKYIHPRIATIKYSVLRMGQTAIDLLFECMGNPECSREYLLDYTIVDGESLT